MTTWFDNFASLKGNGLFKKAASSRLENLLNHYTAKSGIVLTAAIKAEVMTHLEKSGEFSDESIVSAIRKADGSERIKIGEDILQSSKLIHRAEGGNTTEGKTYIASPSINAEAMKKPVAREIVAEVKNPTSFEEALIVAEQNHEFSLNDEEKKTLIIHAKKKKWDQMTMAKLSGSIDLYVKMERLAAIGRGIGNANRIQTTAQQVNAGLESHKNMEFPSLQEEADNLRYITKKYPKDKDARDEDVKKQVREERDTKKKIANEKPLVKSGGLEDLGMPTVGDEKTPVELKELKHAPPGFGSGKAVPAGEAGKIIERHLLKAEEIQKVINPLKENLKGIEAKLKTVRSEKAEVMEPFVKKEKEIGEEKTRFKEESLAPVEQQQKEALDKLATAIERLDKADQIVVDYSDKIYLLLEKQSTMVQKQLTGENVLEFFRTKMASEDLLEKFDKWADELALANTPSEILQKKVIKKWEKKSDIFQRAEEFKDYEAELLETDISFLDGLITTSNDIIEGVEPLLIEADELLGVEEEEGVIEFPRNELVDGPEEEELQMVAKYKRADDFIHLGSKKEYWLDSYLEDGSVRLMEAGSKNEMIVSAEKFQNEFEFGQGKTIMATSGYPNDVDKCRDCTYFSSGVGTVYYKCSTCIHAYSEEQLDDMKDDINELSDFFNDRGLSKSVPDNASNFQKKHASLDNPKTDQEIILSVYKKEISAGASHKEAISSAAKEMLPIGFDEPYWNKKAEEIVSNAPAEAPPKPGTPSAPPSSPPGSPGKKGPFNPSRPSVMPKPKARGGADTSKEAPSGESGLYEAASLSSRQAAYEDEAHENIKNFWTNIPEDHPYSSHQLMKEHGGKLSQEAFEYNNEKLGGKEFDMGSLQKIAEIESQHKQELESMAQNIVVEMFGIDDSMLKVNLGEVQEKGSDEPPEGQEPEPASEMTPELLEHANKRVTMNAMTHGSAAHGYLSAHYLIDEAIRRISPELLELYTSLAAGTNKYYWTMDFAQMFGKDDFSAQDTGETQIGAEFIEFEKNEETGEEQPVVNASAKFFPALVHELIKGIMELLTMNGLSDYNEGDLKAIYDHADRFPDEQWLIQIGPALWRKFLTVMPDDGSLAEVISALSMKDPQFVQSFVNNVVSNPEAATQMAQELLSGGMEAASNGKVWFNKKGMARLDTSIMSARHIISKSKKDKPKKKEEKKPDNPKKEDKNKKPEEKKEKGKVIATSEEIRKLTANNKGIPLMQLFKKADDSGNSAVYEVKSPFTGETVTVTPGQLAMYDGYVEDSKGNKFKAEGIEEKVLQDQT